MSRILTRRNSHQQKFSAEQVANIEKMLDRVDHAYEVMIENLKAEHFESMDLRLATDCEIEINELRNTLREEEIYRIDRGEGDYRNSVYYLDTVSEIERMGDFIINISQALEK